MGMGGGGAGAEGFEGEGPGVVLLAHLGQKQHENAPSSNHNNSNERNIFQFCHNYGSWTVLPPALCPLCIASFSFSGLGESLAAPISSLLVSPSLRFARQQKRLPGCGREKVLGIAPHAPSPAPPPPGQPTTQSIKGMN